MLYLLTLAKAAIVCDSTVISSKDHIFLKVLNDETNCAECKNFRFMKNFVSYIISFDLQSSEMEVTQHR